MPTPSDATIRAAIASTITGAAATAVVYDWWVLGHEVDEWPGLLRSSSDVDSNGRKRVHGYVITRRESAGEWVGNRNAARRSYTYWILGFHYYSTGTSASNSEATFTAEIDAITDAFDDRTTIDSDLSRIEPIAWSFDLRPYGGELLHVARGTITVQPCG